MQYSTAGYTVHSSPSSTTAPLPLHSSLEALERFGIPYLCYASTGSRALLSPVTRDLLESCGGAGTIQQADTIATEELRRGSLRRKLTPFPCVRLVPTRLPGYELAVHLTNSNYVGVAAIVVLRARHGASPESAELSRLSVRERQVATMIALGHSSKVVGARLGISIHTVRHHIERVYAKLEVHSRAEIARVLATVTLAPGRPPTRGDDLLSLSGAASASMHVIR